MLLSDSIRVRARVCVQAKAERQLQKIAQKQQAWEQVIRNARIEYVGKSQ